MAYEYLIEVKLTYPELLLIDGKVSESVQKIIDDEKMKNSFGFELPIMNQIIMDSLKKGTFNHRYKSITSCKYCDKHADFERYTKNTRNHRKGEQIFGKFVKYNGLAFNEGFLIFEGYGDICTECETKYNVIERLKLFIIEKDLHIELIGDERSRYKRDNYRVCSNDKCKKEMKESEMGKRPCWVGNGSYPAECPYCQSTLTHYPNGKFEMKQIKE